MEPRRTLLVCAAMLAVVSAGRLELRVPRAPPQQQVTLRVPSGARQLLRLLGGDRDPHETEVTRLASPRDLKVRVLPSAVVVTWSDPVQESRPAGPDTSKRFYTVRYRQTAPAAPWYYQTAMAPRVVITHVTPGTQYEMAARVSEGETDGPWCAPVTARTHARAHPDENHSVSSANQKPERRGQRPSERERAVKPALGGRGDRQQQQHNPHHHHHHRGDEKAAATKRRTGPPGTQPEAPLVGPPDPTTDAARGHPDAPTRHLWLIDTEQNILYTKDGNVVYDENGVPVRLCVAEDGHTIISEERQPVLTRDGTLVVGFNTIGAAATGNETASSRSKAGGGLAKAGVLLHDGGGGGEPGGRGEDAALPEVVGGDEATLSDGGDGAAQLEGDEGTVSDGVALGYGADGGTSRAGGGDGSPPSESHVTLLKKKPGSLCSISDALEQVQQHVEAKKNIELSKSFRYLRNTKTVEDSVKVSLAGTPGTRPIEPMVVAVDGCPSFVVLEWSPGAPLRGDTGTPPHGYVVQVANASGMNQHRWLTAGFTNNSFLPVENLQPNEKYYFKVKTDSQTKPEVSSNTVMFVTGSESKEVADRSAGASSVWTPFAFHADPRAPSACSGKRFVKRTLQHKLVGVSLCNSLRYKIYLGEDLRGTFYALGDAEGRGEDHCEFVDSPWDGKTGPLQPLENLTNIDGYHRSKRQQRLTRGTVGGESGLYHAGWYECGVAIPGSW